MTHSRRSAAIPALLLVAALSALAAGASLFAATPGTIAYRGASYPLRVETAGAAEIVALGDIASLFGWRVGFDAATRSYSLTASGHSLALTTDSSFATLDGTLKQLPGSPQAIDGVLYVSPELVTRVLAPALGWQSSWNAQTRELRIEDVRGQRLDVRVSLVRIGETSKLVLQFPHKPSFRIERGERTVTLVFPRQSLSAERPILTFQDPLVERLAIEGERVTLTLTGPGIAAEPYELDEPPRIAFDLARGLTPLAPLGQETPVAGPAAPFTVVIDPGHGGTDVGAKGAAGLLEKDVCLDIARRVKEQLDRRGWRVIMTRSSDLVVALPDRTALANHHQADLFVSIHANASPDPAASGAETYFLSLQASDAQAQRTATAENAGGEPPPVAGTVSPAEAPLSDDLRLILWDLAQSHELTESSRLAETIQADMNALGGIRSRGIKQAPFRVLMGAMMPAVLFEVAFISNAEEEVQLGKEEFKDRVAVALAGSLVRYRQSLLPPPPPAAPPPFAGAAAPSPAAAPAPAAPAAPPVTTPAGPAVSPR